MAAPASEDLRELARELELATERNETLSRAQVQEQFGVGASEADAMLSVLREHAQAFEDAPGEWRGPTMQEMSAQSAPAPAADPPRVVVRGPRDEDEVEADAARPLRQRGALVEPTVRLTRAIADALDPDALGKLVQAGLGDVADGEVFVMEVTP